MTVRSLSPATQRSYVSAVSKFYKSSNKGPICGLPRTFLTRSAPMCVMAGPLGRSRLPIARSNYYRAPASDRDAEIIAHIEAICAEFEAYGYRRVTFALRLQGRARR